MPPEGAVDVETDCSGANLTVREILNKIAASNGCALWVVRLTPSKIMDNERFYAQGYLAGGQSADFCWRFIPLKKTE